MTVNIGNAQIMPRGDYTHVLQRIQQDGTCPFCRENLMRYHEKPVLFEGPNWLVTENMHPYPGTKHHFLVISIPHIMGIEEVTPEGAHEFFAVYRRLRKTYGFAGASVFWRSGDTNVTGASVAHLHYQVIVGHARTEGAEPIKALTGFGPAK